MAFRFQSFRFLRNWVVLCVSLLFVVLLLNSNSFLILRWPQRSAKERNTAVLPLDMATDSIDDMYNGCRSESVSTVELFGVFEWQVNRHFSVAWMLVERIAKKPVHKNLTDDHSKAVYVFTRFERIRQNFSRALRTGKHKYSTDRFRFHYFYFYLTDAIQVLNKNWASCRTMYHRTWKHFERNIINTYMRFGALTWAVSSKESFELNGNVSCFEIYTCFGADITHYSSTDQKGQVLIPTYEVFKVTDVLTDDLWCSVVYKLRSTEVPRTDQNCKLFQSLKTFFNPGLTQLHGANVVVMSTYLSLIMIISFILVKHNQKRYVATVLGGLLVVITVALLLSNKQSFMMV
ncbi:ecto-ADP-ribosyltransferase 4-like [Kryptolebias marmoratus]|uniref:NAD(P)(+)--arginine ADP-ribosyltransferase n=1 Tax=Kryptolebias marmoratus TaxID=37003 RepID=A0A3Q3B3C8_KRYMA|nr:ecto-ADP-ribosyltransferase 4-like [Kryptolebias marmoratus]